MLLPIHNMLTVAQPTLDDLDDEPRWASREMVGPSHHLRASLETTPRPLRISTGCVSQARVRAVVGRCRA